MQRLLTHVSELEEALQRATASRAASEEEVGRARAEVLAQEERATHAMRGLQTEMEALAHQVQQLQTSSNVRVEASAASAAALRNDSRGAISPSQNEAHPAEAAASAAVASAASRIEASIAALVGQERAAAQGQVESLRKHLEKEAGSTHALATAENEVERLREEVSTARSERLQLQQHHADEKRELLAELRAAAVATRDAEHT